MPGQTPRASSRDRIWLASACNAINRKCRCHKPHFGRVPEEVRFASRCGVGGDARLPSCTTSRVCLRWFDLIGSEQAARWEWPTGVGCCLVAQASQCEPRFGFDRRHSRFVSCTEGRCEGRWNAGTSSSLVPGPFPRGHREMTEGVLGAGWTQRCCRTMPPRARPCCTRVVTECL